MAFTSASVPCIEYGYEQIEGYLRKCQGKRVKPKRWINLPTSIEVHTFPSNIIREPESKGCGMRTVSSISSISTLASASEFKCVRFSDGVEPGSDAKSADKANAALAEWIYIDRDICGCSLYQYAPKDPKKRAYASSEYGRLFLENSANLESCSKREHEELMACEMRSERYSQEESDLDDALMAAGVKETLLQPKA